MSRRSASDVAISNGQYVMANILIIDDDLAICQALCRKMEKMGHLPQAAQSLETGRKIALEGEFDIILLDLELPDGNGLTALPDLLAAPSSPEVIIVTGTGDLNGADLAFKYGAWDFVPKPISLSSVALPVARALQYRSEKVAQNAPRSLDRSEIIGESHALRSCLNRVAQAAASQANVLITGETGAGKELIARSIHNNSRCAHADFVVVDCAALPKNLVESVLFGHEKGAFTGADQAADGLVAQADGGTLFLDEVGELPMAVQKSFLRVLQEHRFRPVGGRKETPSDFRLMAATNRDLDAMVSQGGFREDLLFRIRSFSIQVPPLRERIQDIEPLVFHQLARHGRRAERDSKGFSPEFMECLMAYDWTGNVRELFNTLDSALTSAGDAPTLYPKHLPANIRLTGVDEPSTEAGGSRYLETPSLNFGAHLPSIRDYRAAMDVKYLTELMRRAKGSITQACLASGLSKSQLHHLVKKHAIPKPRA